MDRKLFPGLIILLMLVSSCTSKTADKEDIARNDSIKKYLDLAGDMNLDNKKREKYNDKAYSYLDFSNNDSLTRRNLFIIGINNANLIRFKRLKTNANDLYDLAIKSNNPRSTANAYKLRGLYYMYMSENENAVEYFYKAKKIFLKLNAYRALVALNKDIAQVQYYSNDFLGSNKTLFENLKKIKQVIELEGNLSENLMSDLFRNYTSIASNFASLKDYKTSILFEKKAIEYANGKLMHLNNSFIGIASSYISLREYDKALYYINKILKNPKTKSVDPTSFYTAKSQLAYQNLIQNEMDQMPQVFFEIDKYYENNDDLGGQNSNQSILSEYYFKVGDTLNAIKSADKAVALSKSYKNPSDILASLNQLIKVDKKNASTNAQEYIRINDSMQIAERKFRDKFARIAFETDEIKQQKNAVVKQKWIITATSGILILLIILILIITKQRARQNELQLLQSQQKANEEIYNLMLSQKNAEDLARQQEKQRIAIELHDGVMNRLASTRLNLHILSYKKDDETIRTCMDSVNELCSIEKEIRHIAHDLNLENFNTDSFTSLLTDLVATQNNTTNTNYKLEIDEYINWIDVHASTKMNVYRIIQEACHNINKSAQADNAVISFILDDGNLCLSVTDDGKGFDVNKHSGGMGLKNMKLRVKNMGGKFVIQSRNKSTSLNISIPISKLE